MVRWHLIMFAEGCKACKKGRAARYRKKKPPRGRWKDRSHENITYFHLRDKQAGSQGVTERRERDCGPTVGAASERKKTRQRRGKE